MKKLFAILGSLSVVLSLYAQEVPSFPGGQDALNSYISEHTQYPLMAKENGIEGIVQIGFTVMTDGSLSNAKVLRFIDPDLEKEALRVVTGMPAWIPAEKDGTPIEAPSVVDIPFILE